MGICGNCMKRKCVFGLLTVALSFSPVTFVAAPPLKLAETVPLPHVKGGFDLMAADVPGKRLFVAAEDNNTLAVIDLAAGKHLRSVAGLNEPQRVGDRADRDGRRCAGQTAVRRGRRQQYAGGYRPGGGKAPAQRRRPERAEVGGVSAGSSETLRVLRRGWLRAGVGLADIRGDQAFRVQGEGQQPAVRRGAEGTVCRGRQNVWRHWRDRYGARCGHGRNQAGELSQAV